MEIRQIETVLPCCERAVRLTAVAALPRQVNTRRCVLCRTSWHIERSTTTPREGVTIDVLSWTDTATRLYTRKYGDGR